MSTTLSTVSTSTSTSTSISGATSSHTSATAIGTHKTVEQAQAAIASIPVLPQPMPAHPVLTPSDILTPLFNAVPELRNRNLTDSQLMALGLYFSMLPRPTRWNMFFDKPPIEQICEVLGVIETISITTPAPEMLRIFNTFRVIQLRPLAHDVLVLGCGNEYNDHDHSQADTVDMDMRANPSIIAIWGQPQTNDYFSGRNYRVIVDEGPLSVFAIGSSPAPLDEFFATSRLALRPNGFLVIPESGACNEIIERAAIRHKFAQSEVSWREVALGHTDAESSLVYVKS